MRRALHEPFLQFALIGAALFGLNALGQRRQAAGDEVEIIEVSSPARALDVALYRAAKAQGLDEGDPVIQARLVARMRAVMEATVRVEAPDEAALDAWLKAHPARYRRPDRLNFEHRFFDATRRGWIGALLAALSPSPPEADDPFPLGRRARNRVAAEIDHHFGAGFSAAVLACPEGRWVGPVLGARGVHWVRRGPLRPGGVPPRAVIEAQLRADWRAARREAALRAAERALLDQYEVRVVTKDGLE
ncbi:peptidyl-prolyl cis-trans isomerase [Myxococcota bacterium]|nr:peptidyl-prolyl cis-trans isomerase [Myxococcota bacterium]